MKTGMIRLCSTLSVVAVLSACETTQRDEGDSRVYSLGGVFNFAVNKSLLGEKPQESAPTSGKPGVTADEKLLLLATEHADFDVIRVPLKKGVTPNLISERGEHLSMVAVRSQSPQALELLVEQGLDLNGTGSVPYTAISMAAGQKSSDRLNVFIKHKADLNLIPHSYPVYAPPISMALQSNRANNVLALVSAGADVTMLDYEGTPPIIYAFKHRDPVSMKAIIDHGGNANLADGHGTTLLMASAKIGIIEFVKLLVASGADLHAQDKSGNSVLLLGISSGNSAVIGYLKKQLGIT